MTLKKSWGKWKRYGNAARKDAHQMLEWGFHDARPHFTLTDDEVTLTDRIVRAINVRLNATAPRRFRRYSVRDDVYQPSVDRFGIERRRVDILVERTTTQPRLLYIFEAKRLRRGSHPLSQYLGNDGLRRFVQREYAEEALEAAMIGYVQTPTVADWGAELEAAFARTQRDALRVVRGLDRVSISATLTDTWESVHAREDAADITICHVLLDCCLAA